jgi:hypothetical protein
LPRLVPYSHLQFDQPEDDVAVALIRPAQSREPIRHPASSQIRSSPLVGLALVAERLGNRLELTKAQLLTEAIAFPPDMSAGKSRREIGARLGLGAAAVVASIVAPMPAQAASCRALGERCIEDTQCCSLRCFGFRCEPR